jgi:hypothetical protein
MLEAWRLHAECPTTPPSAGQRRRAPGLPRRATFWNERRIPTTRFLTYQDLAEAVQESTGIATGVPFRHWIGGVLGAVALDQRSPEEPLLTALVVTANGSIGAGYAGAVGRRDGSSPEDLDMHAAFERLACYHYFGAQLPPDGGQPRLTPQVAAKRQQRSRVTKPSIPTRYCPNCSLQLPSTGACSNCVND